MVDTDSFPPGARRGWLPVRACVLALVVALVAVSWVYCGAGMVTAWRQRVIAQEQEIRAETTNHLALWTRDLAFERGRSAVVLRGGRISPRDRAFLDERRRAGDAAAARALSLLTGLDPVVAARLTRDRAALDELRQRADVQMALPLQGRDTEFVTEWFAAVSLTLSDIQTVVGGVVPTFPGAWNGGRLSVGEVGRLASRAFEFREAAGRESSVLGQAMAEGGPASAATLMELGRLRGASDAAWVGLRHEVALLGDDARAPALLLPLERGQWSEFRHLQDRVLAALTAGRQPEIPIVAYLGASVPVLDAAAALMADAARLDLDRLRLIRRDADRNFRVALGGLVLASVLGLGVLVLLHTQVFATGRHLRRYLRALAEGDLDQPPPGPAQGREMADLAQSALRLRQDLVERQRVQVQMARLSRLHRVVVDNAGDGLIGLGGDGRVLFANPAALRMVGWDWSEMEGRNHHGLIHHTRADGSPNPAEECPVMATLVDGRCRHVAHDLFWRKDGLSVPVEYSLTAWTEGDERGIVLVFRDISARLAAEAEIDTLVQDLRRSNTDLEQFAYAVSHDLQAPLRMVSAYVTLLTRALPQPLEGDLAEFRDFITGGAARMAEMIASLLDYARVGTRGGEARPVDLAAVLAGVQDTLAPQIVETGAVLDLPPDPPWVMADPVQLGRVVQNLVGNALKYRSADRVPRIVVTTRTEGAMVRIEVADNGPGLAEGEADTVFGLFRRGVNATDPDGLGMGLAICRRIVERLGGVIGVRAADGGGACFFFTLPATVDGVIGSGATTGADL